MTSNTAALDLLNNMTPIFLIISCIVIVLVFIILGLGYIIYNNKRG